MSLEIYTGAWFAERLRKEGRIAVRGLTCDSVCAKDLASLSINESSLIIGQMLARWIEIIPAESKRFVANPLIVGATIVSVYHGMSILAHQENEKEPLR